MQYSKAILLAAAALFSSAWAADNTIDFVNQDGTTRELVFTPSAGFAEVPSVTIDGHKTQTVTMPQGWQGNVWSHNQGSPAVPGILAEFTFQSDNLQWFDASAIVNPKDDQGVKVIFPKDDPTHTSGCQSYATTCNNAYNLPNDVQTKSTESTAFVVLLGTKQNKMRRAVNRMREEFA